MYKGKQRVLLAFDRWNLLLYQPLKNELANLVVNWWTFSIKNGLVLYGTSSSFKTNSNAFSFNVFPESSDKNESLFLNVDPYSKNEVDLIVCYMKENFKSNDCIFQHLNHHDIFRLIGYVPRFIKRIRKERISYNSIQINVFRNS